MAYFNDCPDYIRPPNVTLHWEGFTARSYDLATRGWKFEAYRNERTFAQVIAMCSPHGDSYGRFMVDDYEYRELVHSKFTMNLNFNVIMGKDIVIQEYSAPSISNFKEVDASPDAIIKMSTWKYSDFIFPLKERIAKIEEPKLIIPNSVTIAEVLDVLSARHMTTNREYFEQQIREEKAKPLVKASVVSLQEYRKAA